MNKDACDHLQAGHGPLDFRIVPKKEPMRSENLTDSGMGRRFAQDHGDKVRYLHDRGGWRVWDGKRWAPVEYDVIVAWGFDWSPRKEGKPLLDAFAPGN